MVWDKNTATSTRITVLTLWIAFLLSCDVPDNLISHTAAQSTGCASLPNSCDERWHGEDVTEHCQSCLSSGSSVFEV